MTISSRIKYDTALSTATATGICLSQTPGGAGALTLNGSLVTAGIATLDTTAGQTNARQVLLTTTADETAKTFTISGTVLLGGGIVTETITGVNNTTAASTNYFITVTGITVSAGTAGAVTFGTNGVGASMWRALNHRANPMSSAVYTILKSGTVTWTIQDTGDDVFDPTVLPVAFNHSVIASKSANTNGNYAYPPIAVRTQIASGTGTVTTEFVQAQDQR